MKQVTFEINQYGFFLVIVHNIYFVIIQIIMIQVITGQLAFAETIAVAGLLTVYNTIAIGLTKLTLWLSTKKITTP